MPCADDSQINRLLEESRRGLDRIEAVDLPTVQAAGALVVDIRPSEQRERDGGLPGAVVVDRNVSERIGLANATDLCGGYQAWLAENAAGQ
ncbi:hypothetical protein [Nocardioides sp. SYSU DS0663]|uniref:hypothetical protein n=1 Tax=Nocardioides sp. SYSU DS0663 TaxID=3416445 RepID=UPI003F4C9D69